ncbi:hypothetical protein KHP57_01390 [Algiphilus sp. NNCM1]|uniref:hypothetical protein n=1 Tax=Algiphilus sp. TaxID=1872431 RepID=UPI001CA60D39|nr:hypothetical protein [Algiphilus sp.]MBY8964343.1 hypothetical protein [Algiphilus acroporae]MCI5064011.1 hypothetical protein [Algiphilus sp.]MCI5102482.1 hypothetical protein [Algiphilus sp.]
MTLPRYAPRSALLAVGVWLAACSPNQGDAPERSEGLSVSAAALEGACDQYLTTYNRVSGTAMEQFYQLYRAAGESEASIESARDHWRFLGGQIEAAMLEDEWASLTTWHRNLQDHLHSIAVLSGENLYDFPEQAEKAVTMSDQLEAEYVRCKFLRSLRGDATAG